MSDDARTSPSIDSVEHDSNASAKRVQAVLWNGTGYTKAPTAFFTKPYDSVVLTYTDSSKGTLSTAESKLSGIVQETITLTQGGTTDTYTRA